MDEAGDITAVQVCVRVRPPNERERVEGHRTCVSFDEPTKQVVLEAVNKDTLLQLRGAAAKGYAFDRRFGQEATSDDIYDAAIAKLVESCFKGYNGTVLAYGQTGSGKTHTMSGGVGIHGKKEEGITPRVIRHIFSITEQLNRKAKPGEKIEITATALELYNEELLDLSLRSGKEEAARLQQGGWDSTRSTGAGLKLQERPVGKDGRVIPEVIGLREHKVVSAADLQKFFYDCMENRSTSSTKLNDQSSRSHALFTISISRTQVEVMNELGDDMRAKVRTVEFNSKLHLVDLAGSERVKRSGVTGKELKEATHINSGLLALGNVIVALSGEGDNKGKKAHVPYRDSKLTRLLQDSLGGNSLTVLISCISPSEMDFEETNNTLKYANRACAIKNTPLPSRYTQLEEDLLPSIPAAGGMGLAQLQALLEDHERLKEVRERKEKERKEREARRMADLAALREEQVKKPGYQRLRASQYDELRRQLAGRATNIPQGQVIADDNLVSFGNRHRLVASSMDGIPGLGGASSGSHTPSQASARGSRPTSSRAARGEASARRTAGVSQSTSRLPNTPGSGNLGGAANLKGQSFADWLAAQQASVEDGASSQGGAGPGSSNQDQDDDGGLDFIVEDDQVEDAAGGLRSSDCQAGHDFLVDDSPADTQPSHVNGSAQPAQAGLGAEQTSQELDGQQGAAAPVTKSKFRRGAAAAARPAGEEVAAMSPTTSVYSIRASEAGASSMDVQAPASEGAALHSVAGDLGAALEDADGEADQDIGEGAGEPLGEVEEEEEEIADEELPYDPISDVATPKLLARFKVNTSDVLSVFKAVSKEDYQDVIGLLPPNTPLPASDKMTYLLARLESAPTTDLDSRLARVAAGDASMTEAVGPAVGCLMATFGTNMISSCIFDFPDPPDLKYFDVEERIELWGLQIPHNSVRQPLVDAESAAAAQQQGGAGPPSEEAPASVTWSSVDRLNMSIGLLFALCNHALDSNVRCGFCVPRPQLLKRWMQAGVKMRQITGQLQLIYPPSAHDYEYYKASTVAYFMIHEVRDALNKVLAVVN